MIYIDQPQNRGRLGSSSKMISDSGIDELKSFVSKIGLDPSWIKTDSLVPHVNIYPQRRVRAIEAGAQPITRQQYIALIVRLSQPRTMRKAG